MPAGGVRFEHFIARYGDQLRALSRKGVSVVASFPEGGPLLDASLRSINASILDGGGCEFLALAIDAHAFDAISSPVLIDADRACVAHRALGSPRSPDGLNAALLRGRIRLQGTDGVRGVVASSCDGNPVLHFARTGELTPELVRILGCAFGRLAARAGTASKGAEAVFGEDGRDKATGGLLSAALKEGLLAAGLTVLDLGVAPTPAVPFAQLVSGARLGAALTASHNPASQNGVKFFIDGLKMLPEGPSGDFALSALAYELASEGALPAAAGAPQDASRLLDDFARFVVHSLPASARGDLGSLDLMFDPANGAFVDSGRKVFAALGLKVGFVNDDPRGHNINQGGGVAEIEGRDVIARAEAAGNPSLASVSTLLDRASRTGRAAFMLVMDGDGDRGYVVISTDGHKALVVDGDCEAFIIARYMRQSGLILGAQAESSEFVGTVESDLELFRAVREQLGLRTLVNCVGDKWLSLGHRSSGSGRLTPASRLAVGEEVSGHVLWPIPLHTTAGDRELLAGNGLLTALWALAAGIRLGLSPAEFARPFPRGVFITRQTYNVDKALFFPGSAAWTADLECIGRALGGARGSGFSSWRLVERPEEPDMLYAALEDGRGGALGAVFVRNSGTENKTNVYARGSAVLEPLLSGVCQLLWQSHRETLKDVDSLEYRLERAVLEALGGGAFVEGDLASKVLAGAPEASPEELRSVLYGMRKEGLVAFVEGKLARQA